MDSLNTLEPQKGGPEGCELHSPRGDNDHRKHKDHSWILLLTSQGFWLLTFCIASRSWLIALRGPREYSRVREWPQRKLQKPWSPLTHVLALGPHGIKATNLSASIFRPQHFSFLRKIVDRPHLTRQVWLIEGTTCLLHAIHWSSMGHRHLVSKSNSSLGFVQLRIEGFMGK